MINMLGYGFSGSLIALVIEHNRKWRVLRSGIFFKPYAGGTESVREIETIGQKLERYASAVKVGASAVIHSQDAQRGNRRIADHRFQLPSLRRDPGAALCAIGRDRFPLDLPDQLSRETKDGQIISRHSNGKFLRGPDLTITEDLAFSDRQMEMLRERRRDHA